MSLALLGLSLALNAGAFTALIRGAFRVYCIWKGDDGRTCVEIFQSFQKGAAAARSRRSGILIESSGRVVIDGWQPQRNVLPDVEGN